MDAQFESLKPDEFALDADGMEEDGLAIGDTVTIAFPTGPREITLASTYDGSIYFAGFIMSLEVFDEAGIKPLDIQLYRQTLRTEQTQRRPKRRSTRSLPTTRRVKVQDQQEYKEAVQDQVNQLLTLIYGLLALAIVIAVLGIVNTLALSVIERTREIGLLRAVGHDPWPAAQHGSVGVPRHRRLRRLLGVVVGVGFGVALQRASELVGNRSAGRFRGSIWWCSWWSRPSLGSLRRGGRHDVRRSSTS